MDFLGGTARRWFALVSAAATLAAILGFVLTSRYVLALVAIGLALALAVSFAWTAREEHQARLLAEGQDAWPQFLGRAIDDGEALLEIQSPAAMYERWEPWARRVHERLEKDRGLKAALDFADTWVERGGNPNDTRAGVSSQLAYLRELRGH